MAAPFPPATSKAWQYMTTKGGLEKNLKLNPSVPLPKPSPTQNLVQVIATALNPVDYKPAEVGPVSRFAIPKPATPGIDFVGRIVTPAADSPLTRGQLVCGVAGSSPLAAGALAQFALTSREGTAAVPEGVDPIDAVTIGVAGLTAYQSVVLRVKKGDRVLINGGSGGTGVLGLQFAKAVGCHVTTTCSTANVELCKSLGADEVVDYKKGSVIEALKASGAQFDHVVDNVGYDLGLYWACHEFTKPGAAYVMVGGGPSLNAIFGTMKLRLAPSKKRKYESFWPKPDVSQMEQILSWIKEGKVKAVIDQRFAFEDAPKAFEKLKTGRARGKVVIDVAPETE